MQRVRVLFLFIFMVYFNVSIFNIGLYMIQSSKYNINGIKQTQYQDWISILYQTDRNAFQSNPNSCHATVIIVSGDGDAKSSPEVRGDVAVEANALDRS